MKRLSLPALLLVALAAPACSSFDAEYERRAGKLAAQPIPVEGAWIGRWQSGKGHGGGELRAVFTPKDPRSTVSATKEYTGLFKAKWGFFTSEYTAAVKSQADISRIATAKITVEADLGYLAGGKFIMNGESTGNTISARYRSDHDEGTIDLQKAGD